LYGLGLTRAARKPKTALSEKHEQAGWIRQIGILTSIPILLVVGPFLGYLAGHWLDGKLGTEPIFTIILLILGFIASGRETYEMIKKAGRDMK
jgi:F0F1-type ATP synthase assembly protein I